jgi:hypothetical protein
VALTKIFLNYGYFTLAETKTSSAVFVLDKEGLKTLSIPSNVMFGSVDLFKVVASIPLSIPHTITLPL